MANKSYEALLADENVPETVDNQSETTNTQDEAFVEPKEDVISTSKINTPSEEKQPLESKTEPNTKEVEDTVADKEKEEAVVEEPKEKVTLETSSTEESEPNVEVKEPEETEPKHVVESVESKEEFHADFPNDPIGEKGVAGPNPNVDQNVDPIDVAEKALREAEQRALETYRSSHSLSSPKVKPSYANEVIEDEPEPEIQQQLQAHPIKEPKAEPAKPKTVEEQLAELNLSPDKLAKVKAVLEDKPEPEPAKEAEPQPKAVYNKTNSQEKIVDGQDTKVSVPKEEPKEAPLENPTPSPEVNFDEQLAQYVAKGDENYPKLFKYMNLNDRTAYTSTLAALRRGEANTKNIKELDRLTNKALEIKDMQG